MSRDQTVYLRHLRLCIDRIATYTTGGEQAFLNDTRTQDAVVRNLEIVGQAVKDIGADELAARHPCVPWKQIAGLRNVLAHQYLGVDLGLIWKVVENHLPQLSAAIDAELSNADTRG